MVGGTNVQVLMQRVELGDRQSSSSSALCTGLLWLCWWSTSCLSFLEYQPPNYGDWPNVFHNCLAQEQRSWCGLENWTSWEPEHTHSHSQDSFKAVKRSLKVLSVMPGKYKKSSGSWARFPVLRSCIILWWSTSKCRIICKKMPNCSCRLQNLIITGTALGAYIHPGLFINCIESILVLDKCTNKFIYSQLLSHPSRKW